MSVLSSSLAVVLAVVCLASALADFRRHPEVMATLDRLKIPAQRAVLLGLIKVAAASGLLIGFAVRHLQLITGAALVMYFAIAVTSHVRVRDGVRHAAPAFVLCAVSVMFTLAELAT